MSSFTMKIPHIKSWSFFITLVLCCIFFILGSRYNNVKSAYFQLKLIDSFERNGEWGGDGHRFKIFLRSINVNTINNYKSGIFSRFYVYLIEKSNPSYPNLLSKAKIKQNNEKNVHDGDLIKKLQDGLGSGVEIDLRKEPSHRPQ